MKYDESFRAERMLRKFDTNGGCGPTTFKVSQCPQQVLDAVNSVSLNPGELPLVICYRSPVDWILFTTRRLVVNEPGDAIASTWARDIVRIQAAMKDGDSRRMLSRDQWTELTIEIRDSPPLTISVDPEPAFSAIHNLLLVMARMQEE